SFYTHDAQGKIVPPVPDWNDVADLDYGNPRLRAYMIGMLRKWVHDFDLDGFRCDVAGMVPESFWAELRTALDAEKPGLFLLAEADEPDLLVRAFDSDYSWSVFHAVDDALAGRKPARAVRE